MQMMQPMTVMQEKFLAHNKTGLILSNSPGTIDAGYRGEVMAVFYVQGMWEHRPYY